ncbi:glycosyltransferase family 2 protein [Rikenella microfusus]|uniref:glycosyltransferase family 2 protein n=1 Tax=Rikenella microfusus TaxID=28139 RepID=UPI00248F2385|nr:glycosyltransferase family 2 protein [Rikenella microfusus]
MIRTGIVIVSYNTCDLLRDCLRSVFAQTDRQKEGGFRVVVVDNGSEDGSAQMVRREFPETLCVEAEENLGFGRANNLGVERLEALYGRAEYLFFLNPDTVLLNDAVGILAGFLDRRPEAAAAGGNLYGADGVSPAQSFSPVHGLGWELTGLMPEGFKRLVWPAGTWFNYGTEPRRVGYVSGADLMVRREALDGKPAFDPDFFMYYEDMELCVRLRRDGWGVWSVPQARIVHLAGQSCAVSKRKFRMLSEAKYIYYGKVRGRFYARAVYALTQAGYRCHERLGRLTRNAAKSGRYGAWAAANRSAWRHFTEGI